MIDSARIDRVLLESVSLEKGIPGAVLIAVNRNGDIIYANSSGKRSFEPDAPDMDPDTVCWLASFSKVVTAIAAMQCVERGLLALDSPVGDILPEYAEPKILQGFTDESNPIYAKAQNHITLRHLLTHSSGLSYDLFEPRLKRWSEALGRIENQQSGTLEGVTYPLLFEPEHGFTYSVGLDWAGQMIERVNGNIGLEEYFRKNIWEPLGLKSTTFCISSRPDLREKLAGLTVNSPDRSPETQKPRLRDVGAKYFSGGSGLYGTGGDHVRVLAELINDGGVLLKPETVKEMFAPQLPDPKYLREALALGAQGKALNLAPNIGPQTPIQHGLSFLTNQAALPTGRPAGTAQWAGMANTYWWADPVTGIAAVVMTQIVPFAHPSVLALYEKFERALYESL